MHILTTNVWKKRKKEYFSFTLYCHYAHNPTPATAAQDGEKVATATVAEDEDGASSEQNQLLFVALVV